MRLRQPAAEFWRSTPRRMNAFFEHHAAAERVLDVRAGVIAAVVANAHRAKHTRGVGPDAFFSSLRAPAARVMSAEEMRGKIARHFGR